jgi:lysophospholipase L1-like esterase
MMRLQLILISLLIISLSGMERKPVKILMAGDSTMADKPLFKSGRDTITGELFEEVNRERGWGQLLPELISDKGQVVSYARNGRSTRTFIEEGLWTKLIENSSPGDIVVIQFGHNDEVITKKSYTNPVQFRLNFVAFVNEVKARGAHPVLCTSVARRKFDENGKLVPTHGDYPDIIRSVARQENVPLIDLEKITSAWLQQAGVEGSKAFFHQLPPGVSRLHPDGLNDNTHFNEEGARAVAAFFIQEIKQQQMNEMICLIK